jgi:hypothetical protein
MREIDVGVRINLKTGLSFFGMEEVNNLIGAGAVVVAIKPAGVMMEKMGQDKKNVQLTLSGVKLTIVLKEPDGSVPGA